MEFEENNENWSEQEILDANGIGMKCYKMIGGKKEQVKEMFEAIMKMDVWVNGKFLENPMQEALRVYKARYKTPFKDGKVLGLFWVRSEGYLLNGRKKKTWR